MVDEFDGQLASANFLDTARDLVASVASVDPLEVLFQGQQVSAVNGVPNHPLTVGDPVRVTRFAQQLVITGVTATYPVLAVVSAYAAGGANCTVVAGDDTFDAQIAGPDAVTVGDRVLLIWTRLGPFAIKRGGTNTNPGDPPLPPDNMNATTGPDLPTPPPPATGPGQAVLYAQQTACYINSGGIFTGDQARYWLYSGYRGGVSGDVINGFWFYGDQVSKVKGVTVTKLEVWMQRMSGTGPSGATDCGIGLHNTKTKTTTEPATLFPTPEFVTVSLSPGQAKWVNLPLSWGTLLAASSAAGVALLTLYEEPYKALIGIDHPDPAKRNINSGALRVTYKRS